MMPMTDSPDVQRALIARAIAEDHADLTAITMKLDALTLKVEALTQLFEGAKMVVRVVTWVGGLGGVITAIGALLAPFVTFHHNK